jgi:hypothetical protein
VPASVSRSPRTQAPRGSRERTHAAAPPLYWCLAADLAGGREHDRSALSEHQDNIIVDGNPLRVEGGRIDRDGCGRTKRVDDQAIRRGIRARLEMVVERDAGTSGSWAGRRDAAGNVLEERTIEVPPAAAIILDVLKAAQVLE